MYRIVPGLITIRSFRLTLSDSECTAVRVTTLKRREMNVKEEERNNSGRWEKKEYKGKRGGKETEEEDGGETKME
jgi:hypothetical protein